MLKKKDICLSLFAIISCVVIVCSIISIIKNYDLPEYDMPFLQFIFMVEAQEYFGVNFDTAQNIFLTLFTCFFGVYWAVLGIILANKSVSFVDFFSFTFNKLFCINVIILSIDFILFFIVYPLHIYTIAIKIAAFVSYFQIIVCFIIAIKSMAGLQNYEVTVNLVVHKLTAVQKSKNPNKKKLIDSYVDFLSKCFPYKGLEVYIDAINKISNSKGYEQLVHLLFDLLCTVKVENSRDCNLVMDFFIKQIYKCLSPEKQINYNILEKQIDLFFKMYESYLLSGKLSRSYITEIRDSIYYLLNRNLNDQNMIRQYKRIICNSFILISNSFIYMDKRLALSHISDFVSMMEFLKDIPELYEVETLHSRYIVDFAVLIVYLTLIHKIPKDYLNYLERIVSYTDLIIIDNMDRFFYPDLLEPKSPFEVKYTRNFFIDLIFVYLVARKGIASLEDLLKKCHYSIEYGGDDKEVMQYELLYNELEKISNDDYVLYGEITIEDCKVAKDMVKKCLETKTAEIKKYNTEKIKQVCIEKELNRWIEQEKNKIMQAIPGKLKVTQSTEVEIYSAQITLAVSYRELMADPSPMSFGTDYYNLYINWLYSIYLNISSVKKKRITKLIDIKNLEKENLEEKNRLLLPLEYHQYIYSNNIPEIEYFGSEVRIKNYRFDLEFTRCEKGAIVVKKDLMGAFCIQDIIVDHEKKQKVEQEELCNVNVFMPAEIKFAFDKKSERYAYVLC